MEKKWVTYDGIDYYDKNSFEWKKTDVEWEEFKSMHWKEFEDWCNLYGFPISEKEKQVKNGM